VATAARDCDAIVRLVRNPSHVDPPYAPEEVANPEKQVPEIGMEDRGTQPDGDERQDHFLRKATEELSAVLGDSSDGAKTHL
jgi:hypothetical protein